MRDDGSALATPLDNVADPNESTARVLAEWPPILTSVMVNGTRQSSLATFISFNRSG